MSEEQKLVLKMLAEEKITVEEAERLLQAMRVETPQQAPADFMKGLGSFFEDFGRKFEGMFRGEFQDIFGGQGQTQEYTAPAETHRFETGSEARFNMHHQHGPVSIEPWDEPTIEVVATKKARAETSESASQILDAIEVRSSHEDKSLSLETSYPEDQGLWRGKRQASVEYQIRVPVQTSVTLRTQHGDIHVNGVSAPVSLESQHGDIELKGINGAVESKSAHGDLSLSGITGGPIEIHHRHGHLTLNEISADTTARHEHGVLNMSSVTGQLHLERAHGKTSMEGFSGPFNILQRHGDVHMNADLPGEGECQIETSHASIHLTVPSSEQMYLHASTHHGRIQSDFQGKHVDEKLGQELCVGEAEMPLKVLLKSHHGNIRIQKKEGETDE